MKAIAIETCTLEVTNPIVVATIIKTGVASTKSKVGGIGVLKDGFGVQVVAITVPSAGATIPDPGPKNETLSATATKCQALEDHKFVLRVDDETATISATPKIPSTPNPIDFPVTFKVKISAAGQNKAQGN